MEAAFDDDADFSSLGTSPMGNLYISDVLHKTYIELSPAGTKAGAATVVVVDAESAADVLIGLNTYEVILDRPFVYGIIDTETGAPLFLGVLEDPK